MPVVSLQIPAEIAEFIRYEPTTGTLTWVKGLNSRSVAGTSAGSVNRNGYVSLKFRKRAYQAHRVAWFLMTGEQPGEIDHIDRAKANNRWSNLRSVSHSQNCRNREVTEGQHGRGVTARDGRFRASFWLNGRNNHIGIFDTAEEARDAVASAKSLVADAEAMNPVASSKEGDGV